MGQIETSYTIMSFLRQVYRKDKQLKYVCIGKVYIFMLRFVDTRYKQYKIIKK